MNKLPASLVPFSSGRIVFGDNLAFLKSVPDCSIDLIYIDPPFNTGRVQCRTEIKTIRDDESPDRTGFKGQGYRSVRIGQKAFVDAFYDFEAFMLPRFKEAYRVLKPDGSFFLHMDYREVHYCKLRLDEVFGRDSFINEIIWAYDYGARSKRRWSPKHENILWYAKNPAEYTFNFEAMDRIPYMAPSLVGPEKAARGKTPSDTWWNTIVSPTGHEKTGYPTQKPIAIIKRIVQIHSKPGDTVLDFFAGSGTVGEACAKLGRNYILVDNNMEAFEVMKSRLSRFEPQLLVVPESGASPAKTDAEIPPQNVHVIITAVWDYDDDELPDLTGPIKDVEMMKKVFSAESGLGIYAEKDIEILLNPTVERLRRVLMDYESSRSAKGDTLIFYFSGHGAVRGNNKFVFCLKDTRVRSDTKSLAPLSVLTFEDVVQTLQVADVHPIFIIDACFSGSAANADVSKLLGAMQEEVRAAAGNAYALLCACNPDGPAEDTADGGAFTKALFEIATAGLSDDGHKRKPYLELRDLSGPVQTKLSKNGSPLSRFYRADDLPPVLMVRNLGYEPRVERLMNYHKATLELMWNGGNPKTVPLTEIREKCGVSAYGNHSKLSYAPWSLVTDGANHSHRHLTDKGVQFMQQKLTVPDLIQFDPNTGAWIGAKNAKQIGPTEIDVRPTPRPKRPKVKPSVV